MNILRPLPAKLEHFCLFNPCRGKNLTSGFSSITTKLYVWSVITRGICWYNFWQHWSNVWIWPLNKLPCDPQASCTGCDPAAIWNLDPWHHTNIVKLSNLLFLFSWVNLTSVRPICQSICLMNSKKKKKKRNYFSNARHGSDHVRPINVTQRRSNVGIQIEQG